MPGGFVGLEMEVRPIQNCALVSSERRIKVRRGDSPAGRPEMFQVMSGASIGKSLKLGKVRSRRVEGGDPLRGEAPVLRIVPCIFVLSRILDKNPIQSLNLARDRSIELQPRNRQARQNVPIDEALELCDVRSG
jgi:hypothetical protein